MKNSIRVNTQINVSKIILPERELSNQWKSKEKD
jgi:hypothetical protein